MEGFTKVSDSVVNAAPVGGRRHKLKKVSAKTIRRTLRKAGMKPKGRVVLNGGDGLEPADASAAPAMGGKRRTRRRSASHPGGLMKMLGLRRR
jgi:hypothetical protein